MIDDLYAKRTRNSLRNIVSPRKNQTFEQLKIYYEAKNLSLTSKFAESLDLLTNDDAYNYVAYLLADDNATSIKVAKYAGIDKELAQMARLSYATTKRTMERLQEKGLLTRIGAKRNGHWSVQ